MDLRVLGPVTVHAGGRPIELGPRKRRYLLALLALEINHVLPVERLVDLMWPDSPPRTAVHAVRVSASSLRLALREVAAVEASGGGYVLRADPMTVDAHRFRHLVTRAAAETDDRIRLASLDEALGLWRGPALAGAVPAEMRQRLCHGLEEARLAAAEDRLDTLLRLGRHGELLDELTAGVAAHPLRERLVGQLMVALYRCGRVNEALDVYGDARARLADRLGLDPGPDLVSLHRQILSRDPALEVRGPGAPAPAPASLPPAVPGFVGREADLAALDRLLDDEAPAVVITAIGGAAGVGKTSLALHWAHRVAHRFPDGRLYANLRGFGPQGGPAAPQEVVRAFLEALRVPAHQVPEGLAAQADLLRTRLAGKRVLLVLDNAASAEQVRPLLPGTAGCLVVVTSRRRLTSLVAVEGARPLPLDLLTEAEARRLLERRLGRARVAAEPEAVSALVDACARLPLALAIVAARAATNPRLPLSALAAELAGQDGLDPFDAGDARADIRAVLSWSYRAVSEPARRMFRLLGVHPGPEFSERSAASAAAVPVARARLLLRELADAHLLTEASPGRYAGHDLLRAYAAELAAADPECDAARLRVLDHYLRGAGTAAALLDTFRDPVPVGDPLPGVATEPATDSEAALRWFLAEYQVLLAGVRLAARAGADGYAWRLACTLTELFERLGRWDDWRATHETGLAAARRLGEPAAQAHCLVGLGRAAMWLRSWAEAHDRLGQALARFERLGDLDGQARTHHNLGYLYEHQGGDLRLALRHSRRALDLFRACDDLPGIAKALNAVGWYQSLLGAYREAVTHCEEAIVLLRRLGDRRTEALTWDSIACAYQGQGEHWRAIECLHRSLDMLGPLNDPFHEADVAEHLGDSYLAVGDTDAAAKSWRQALDNLVALGHARAEVLRAKLDRHGGGGGAAHAAPRPVSTAC